MSVYLKASLTICVHSIIIALKTNIFLNSRFFQHPVWKNLSLNPNIPAVAFASSVANSNWSLRNWILKGIDFAARKKKLKVHQMAKIQMPIHCCLGDDVSPMKGSKKLGVAIF
jgi:hypothetical protein